MSWLGKFGRRKKTMTRAQFQRHFAGEWKAIRSEDGLSWMQNGEFKTWVDRKKMKCIHNGQVGLRAKTWYGLAKSLAIIRNPENR